MTVLFQAQMEKKKKKGKKNSALGLFSIGVSYSCHTREGFPLQFSAMTFVQVGIWESVVHVSDSTQNYASWWVI